MKIFVIFYLLSAGSVLVFYMKDIGFYTLKGWKGETKEEKKIFFGMTKIVAFAAFFPIFNFILFASLLIFCSMEIGEKIKDLKKEKNIEKKPQIEALEIISETSLLFEDTVADIIEQLYPVYRSSLESKRDIELENYLRKLNEYFKSVKKMKELMIYIKEKKSDSDISEVLMKNERPFLYVQSVFKEHKQVLQNQNSEIFEKMDILVRRFSSEINEIKVRNEEMAKQKEKLEREKMETRKRQEEIEEEKLLQLVENRINEEMDLILKMSVKNEN